MLTIEQFRIVADDPRFPSGQGKAEWNKDHADFVLNVLLPMVAPRHEATTRMIREAYLAGFEKYSDGSSVVPDLAYDWANIKDPMGVTHDYIFDLHHRKLPDASGHHWTLLEANLWYRTAWIDFHHPAIGNTWFVGLCIGSWVPWHFGKSVKRIQSCENKTIAVA